ncbi:nucleotide exchange factor GrpE [Candidatus Corynebacterium faecigallinarum]|uniref:nucleotide exchange factor GrpE n=1 Tax=Candidatus Corynebacterium faecigallinarum TaxID=2838528 RepID=UPI003FCF80D1
MTQPNPADPGDPAVTDEEYTGPDLAETTPEEDAVIDATEAADAAAAAAGNAAAAGDEVLDAEVEDALAEDPATATEATAAADAAADAADEAVAEAEAAPEASPLEVELAERTADLQRVSAEYTNYRRRTERDRGAIRESAKADTVAGLLPIRDDLDLAEQHGDLTGPLKAVADKLDAVFASLKVETFGAEGDEFDPSHHEAVQDMSTGDDKALGTVLRKGYRLGDRVLRTAMVVIADR